MTKRLLCGEVCLVVKPTSAPRKRRLHQKDIPNPEKRQGEPKNSDRTPHQPSPGITGALKSPQHPFACVQGAGRSWISPSGRTLGCFPIEGETPLPSWRFCPVCPISGCLLRSPPARSTSFGSADRAGTSPHPGPASRSFAPHGVRSGRPPGSASSGRWRWCDAKRMGDRPGA